VRKKQRKRPEEKGKQEVDQKKCKKESRGTRDQE